MHRCFALVVLLLAASGCTKTSTAETGARAPEPAGTTAPQGTALAYEHRAELEMQDAAAVVAAAQRVADACREQRFGDCALLGFEQSGGDWPSAAVTMRVAPDGVAPTLALATDAGGALARRTMKAEDLAGTLGDLRRERASLIAQRTRLEDAVAGRRASAADAIALAAELGRIDARLAELEADESAQQRRIDTNLLTVALGVPYEQRGAAVFEGLGEELIESAASGVTEGLTILAFLGPLALLLLLPTLGLALLWRRLWRWATRPRG